MSHYRLAAILLIAASAPAQIQERMDGYVAPLTKRDGAACFDTNPQVCRTPWVKYERTNLKEWMSVFDQIAWVCETPERNHWCYTMNGEGCACSGKQPPGEWQREGEESGLHREIQEHVIEPCSEAISPFLGIGPGAVRYAYRVELGKVADAIVSAAHGKPEGVRQGIYEAGVGLCAMFVEKAAPGGR